jgi:hypothetical protein
MSEAPDRIWADGNEEWDSGSWGCDKEYEEDVEYTRTDLVRAQIEAAVKRALEGAADACSTIIQDYAVMDSTGTKYLPLKTQKAAKSMVSLAREDIRALDPAQFIDGDKQ